jgi:hypothetical protein
MRAEDIVRRYASVARPVILEFFPPNSCIAASRITIEVLRRFGIKAQAVPVSMVVQSKSRDLAFVSGLDMKGRAHQIRPASKNAWNGHCIAIAGGHLIDASFDQCDMADRGVHIPPYILTVRIGDKVRLNSFHAVLEMITDDGEALEVQYFPLNDWSFLQSPAWETDHLQPAIQLICARMSEPVS